MRVIINFKIQISNFKIHQFRPHLLVGDEAVLQHLGIAREDILLIQCLQELRVENHAGGIVKDPDLVLQSVEVDTGLSAHGGIDHREQRGGDVDVIDAPLEGGGRKAPEVGHHAATYIY